MKNSLSFLQKGKAESGARKAISKIKKWAKDYYPESGRAHRTELITECLIELAEERRLSLAR